MAGYYKRTKKEIERARLMGLANKGQKSYPRTQEHKERIKLLGLSNKGRKHTEETKRKISLVSIGKKYCWKGDKVGIAGIHIWLHKYYGKASYCENKICEKIGNTYDWAKLRNKSYKRRRKYFIQLCRSCHKKYDEFRYKIKI